MNGKDHTERKPIKDLDQEAVDAMLFSRPISLPGTAFGVINIFFDPLEINPMEVEKLGRYLTSSIEEFFLSTTHTYSSCKGESIN